MWETFEHTADVGLRVRARDLSSLFAEAAVGMMSIAVENLPAGGGEESVGIRLQADRYEDLLVDWLSEVLGVLERKRVVLCSFSVRVADGKLVANAAGEKLDPQRHVMGQEIKAVTYHALKVRQCEAGWLAEVVLDL